jgi:2',3'-cyclic-nucleotide 2'-phosphodiesterase/3'-nucleotidase
MLTLILCLSLAGLALAEENVITILATSDLHGHIMPVDYFMGTTDEGGLAQIATVTKLLKQANPDTLIIDDGDTIEGGNSTLPYHYLFDSKVPNPMSKAMNLLGYTSMTVGNHEFNYGLDNLNKFRSELNFPVIGANVVNAGDGKPYFQPYVIKEVGGAKVAILGLTTPKIPTWEKPENINGLKFLDPVEVAQQYVPQLRKQADIVVIAAHTGQEKAPKDQKDPKNWNKPENWIDQQSSDENFALRLAQVPGVDVVVSGHSHAIIPKIRKVPGISESDTLVTEPGSWGDYIAKVDIYVEKQGDKWVVTDKDASLFSLAGIMNDDEVVKAAKYYHDQTWKFYTTAVGQATDDMPGGIKARAYDSALVGLINKAQLWATGADISLAALFTESSQMKKGPVSIQNIYGLYIYPNTLYKIQITGAQLRAALEQDAKYWNAYTGQTKLADLVNPAIRGYNWDIYEGIDYQMDLTKPVGERVVKLQFKGKDVTPDQTFTLAVNNYRGGGGGGYPMFSGTKVLWDSGREVREIMVDYIKQLPNQMIDVKSLEDGNFSLLPADLLSKMTDVSNTGNR